MITRNALALNAVLAVSAICPQLLNAQSFTAQDILEWSVEDQDSYYRISTLMVGIVASQMEQNKHIADCIDTWHGEDADPDRARADQIRDAMQDLTDYHPQTVILAVIQKECGKFE